MTLEQVAWAIDGQNKISLIGDHSQTAPFWGDDTILDITVSASGMVFALGLAEDHENAVIYYAEQKFPLDWKEFKATIEQPAKEDDYQPKLHAIKIDAAPSNELYMVMNDGSVTHVSTPDAKTDTVAMDVIDGVNDAKQVSAAADGTLWVVAQTALGSEVRYLDKGAKDWKTIEGLKNAARVTGTAEGGAYVVVSEGNILLVSKTEDSVLIPMPFGANEVSVDAKGRLWVTSQCPSEAMGAQAFYSDDSGVNWVEVENSGVKFMDAGVLETEVELF